MNVQTVIACIAIVAAAAFYIRRRRSRSGDNYDAAQLSEAIETLAQLSEELANVDSLLTDLRACNPFKLLRFFRAQWCGIDGKQRRINFLTDGRNGQTAGLKQAAQEQRDRLNAEIIALIREINAALDAGSAPALTVDAVGESVDETTEAVTVGAW